MPHSVNELHLGSEALHRTVLLPYAHKLQHPPHSPPEPSAAPDPLGNETRAITTNLGFIHSTKGCKGVSGRVTLNAIPCCHLPGGAARGRENAGAEIAHSSPISLAEEREVGCCGMRLRTGEG